MDTIPRFQKISVYSIFKYFHFSWLGVELFCMLLGLSELTSLF